MSNLARMSVSRNWPYNDLNIRTSMYGNEPVFYTLNKNPSGSNESKADSRDWPYIIIVELNASRRNRWYLQPGQQFGDQITTGEEFIVKQWRGHETLVPERQLRQPRQQPQQTSRQQLEAIGVRGITTPDEILRIVRRGTGNIDVPNFRENERERIRNKETPHNVIFRLLTHFKELERVHQGRTSRTTHPKHWGILTETQPMSVSICESPSLLRRVQGRLIFVLIDLPRIRNVQSLIGRTRFIRRLVPLVLIGHEEREDSVNFRGANKYRFIVQIPRTSVTFTVSRSRILSLVGSDPGFKNITYFKQYNGLRMSKVNNSPWMRGRVRERDHVTRLPMIFNIDKYRRMADGNNVYPAIYRLEVTSNTRISQGVRIEMRVFNKAIMCENLIEQAISIIGTRGSRLGFVCTPYRCFTGALVRTRSGSKSGHADISSLQNHAHTRNCGFVAAVLSACMFFTDYVKLDTLQGKHITRWETLLGALSEGFPIRLPTILRGRRPFNSVSNDSFCNWDRLFRASANMYGTLLGYGHDRVHGVNVNFRKWFFHANGNVHPHATTIRRGVNFVTIFARGQDGLSMHHFFDNFSSRNPKTSCT